MCTGVASRGLLIFGLKVHTVSSSSSSFCVSGAPLDFGNRPPVALSSEPALLAPEPGTRRRGVPVRACCRRAWLYSRSVTGTAALERARAAVRRELGLMRGLNVQSSVWGHAR